MLQLVYLPDNYFRTTYDEAMVAAYRVHTRTHQKLFLLFLRPRQSLLIPRRRIDLQRTPTQLDCRSGQRLSKHRHNRTNRRDRHQRCRPRSRQHHVEKRLKLCDLVAGCDLCHLFRRFGDSSPIIPTGNQNVRRPACAWNSYQGTRLPESPNYNVGKHNAQRGDIQRRRVNDRA